MAKYFEHEEMFHCRGCDIEARRSEFYDDCHILRCPNCESKAFHRETLCEMKFDHEELVTTSPLYGVLKFSYMGYGEKELPEISLEETQWTPQFCFDCNQQEMIRKVKVYDGLESVGLKSPHKMLGLDLQSGGSAVILPFSSNHRLFIDGIEQDITVLYSEKDKLWEYFV